MNQDELRGRGSDVQGGVFGMAPYNSKFDHLKTGSFDPQALWERVDGDADLLRELVAIFVDEYPRLLQGIATAIQQEQHDDVRKLSHKLKGSALQFSGTGVSNLAASLERMGQAKSLVGAGQVLTELEQETTALVRSLQYIVTASADSTI